MATQPPENMGEVNSRQRWWPLFNCLFLPILFLFMSLRHRLTALSFFCTWRALVDISVSLHLIGSFKLAKHTRIKLLNFEETALTFLPRVPDQKLAKFLNLCTYLWSPYHSYVCCNYFIFIRNRYKFLYVYISLFDVGLFYEDTTFTIT